MDFLYSTKCSLCVKAKSEHMLNLWHCVYFTAVVVSKQSITENWNLNILNYATTVAPRQ